MEIPKIVQELLDKKAKMSNTVDLDAYANGLLDMHQALQLQQTDVMVQLPKPETIWNNAREMNFLCFKKWFTKIKGN